MELLKIDENNLPLDWLVRSQKKAERRIDYLVEYFDEFERTQFKGRYITNEYHSFKKELEVLKDYHKNITKQINEKRRNK